MKKALMNLKHNVANYFRKNQLYGNIVFKVLGGANDVVFHRDMKSKKTSYGDANPDIIFYVIRNYNNNTEEGLMSLFGRVFREVEYAIESDYYPFIDFQNYLTQYSSNTLINGSLNAWEYYFKQPYKKFSIDDIYVSKNVILTGPKTGHSEKVSMELSKKLKKYDFYDTDTIKKLYLFIKKYMDVQPYIYDEVNTIWNKHFKDKNVIGVFLRGTDYVAFRPKGHPIQPDKKEVLVETQKMMDKIGNCQVFLVTEDASIFSYFEDAIMENLIKINDYLFDEYKGDDYIAKYTNGKAYEVGKIYLIKLLLLSKCDYLVTSITSGSVFADIMNCGRYKEKIVFDLGEY